MCASVSAPSVVMKLRLHWGQERRAALFMGEAGAEDLWDPVGDGDGERRAAMGAVQ